MSYITCRRGVIQTFFGLLALLLLGAAPAVGSAQSQAVAPAAGGYCETDEGVTVVVDMTVFDKGIIVRCVEGPLPSGYTGWDALTDAGFSPQAPARQPGFVCRLAGEPSAARELPVEGDEDYREQCVVTPPQSAYWTYWHASNEGNWTYSTLGAANYEVVEGEFEGFAFSLNGSKATPGIAPIRPSEQPDPPPPTAPPGSGGASNPTPPPKPQPTPTAEPPATPKTPVPKAPPTTPPSSQGSPTRFSDPTPAPPSTTLSPSAPSASSHASGSNGHADTTVDSGEQSEDRQGDNGGRREGSKDEGREGGSKRPAGIEQPPTASESDDGVVITGEVPAAVDEPEKGSAASLLIGLGVLAALAAGAGLTAWRRSHS